MLLKVFIFDFKVNLQPSGSSSIRSISLKILNKRISFHQVCNAANTHLIPRATFISEVNMEEWHIYVTYFVVHDVDPYMMKWSSIRSSYTY